MKAKIIFIRLSMVFKKNEVINCLFNNTRNKLTVLSILFLGGFLLPMTSNAQAAFALPVPEPFNLTNPYDVNNYPFFTDIDADGDLDLFTLVPDIFSSSSSSFFSYYENTGTPTNPSFSSAVTNNFGLTSTNSYYSFPTTADVDADGDDDILVLNDTLGNFAFYENIGTATAPNFDVPVINPFSLQKLAIIGFPELLDFDADGDFDLLCTDTGSVYRYYENIGSSSTPLFASPVLNPFGLVPTPNTDYTAMRSADLDHDGDLDLLIQNDNISTADFSFRYYENTGSATAPSFSNTVSNPFGLQSHDFPVFFALGDLDSDGDMDILDGSAVEIVNPPSPPIDASFFYYENNDTTSVSVSVSNYFGIETDVKIFPNPATSFFHVQSKKRIKRVIVMDLKGQFVMEKTEVTKGVNIEHLPSGIYMLSFEDMKGQFIRRSFLKE